MENREVKVDMAILPSCGLGSRLGDLTKNNPKCMVKVNGEPLIERQIKQLKSVGIDNIVVMTGYLSEQLEFLKDKYSVKLIYNEEYATKNTIATLYKALDEIRDKNIYISCTDQYYTENPFHATEKESFMAGSFKHDCTGEWVGELGENNRLLKVVLDGFDDYYYAGLCFLKTEMVNKLSVLLDECYRKEGNEQMYWEEAMVYNLDKLPPLYYHKYEYGIINEIDTPDDLNTFMLEQEAVKEFARIFSIKDTSLVRAQRVIKSLNNLTFKVDYDGKSYFFRRPGKSTEEFNNREVEYEVYKILGKYDIADEVIYFDVKTGNKVAKYYRIAKSIDISRDEELKDAMRAYRRLHNIKGSISASCEIMDVFNNYISMYEKLDINPGLNRFDENMSVCIKKAKWLSSLKRPHSICHGDCGDDNIIYTEEGIKIIDFEFAGMADPLSDIALFGVFVDYGVEDTLKLYEFYRDAKGDFDDEELLADDSLNRKLVANYMVITCMNSVLWGIMIKHNRQSDMDDYINEKYDLLNRLIEEVGENV